MDPNFNSVGDLGWGDVTHKSVSVQTRVEEVFTETRSPGKKGDGSGLR